MAGIIVPYQKPSRKPPRLAFVAEAPSGDEEYHGVPLIGPSGRIFNAELRAAGIDRSECLVTNVFDQKLPGNEVANWCVPLADARSNGWTDIPPIGDAGFLRGEHRYHLERLQAELEEWDPIVVVPLGVTALWALTGQTRIGAVRGAVLPATRLVPGKKLVPTYHPAFVMRQWKFHHVVIGDFIKASNQAVVGRDIILPKRELLLEPTLADIEAYLPRLLASDLLSVDIETGWGQIKSIGFAPDVEHAIVIPFIDLRVPSRSYWPTAAEEVRAWGYVRTVLESEVPKLGQNFAQYDAYWLLEKEHIGVRNLREDTRLLSHALYPELPKSLEFMGNSYAMQGVWKSWGKGRDKRDD